MKDEFGNTKVIIDPKTGIPKRIYVGPSEHDSFNPKSSITTAISKAEREEANSYKEMMADALKLGIKRAQQAEKDKAVAAASAAASSSIDAFAASIHAGVGVGILTGGLTKMMPGAFVTAEDSQPLIIDYKKPDTEAPKFKTVEEKFAELLEEELKRYDGTDASVSITEVFGRVLTSMQQTAAACGTSLIDILESVMADEEKSAKLVALEQLAAELTKVWNDEEFTLEPIVFTLTTPSSLTVWREATSEKSAGYSKQSHIGGESFAPVGAYVGKRGFVILKFKPQEPANYSWIEVPLTDALLNLQGFQAHFVNSGGAAKWNKIQEAEQEARKAADLAKFGDTYNDFGSY